MNLTEIGTALNTSTQNVSQIASKGIKKLFKNAKKEYGLTYLETYEMILVGLDIIEDESDIKYVFKHLDKKDQRGIEDERKLKGKKGFLR
jgi:hypothetical protein